MNACRLIMIVALCLGCGSESSKDESKSVSGKSPSALPAQGSPGYAFRRMHELLRGGDVDGLWAIYSAEMKEGMVMKIRVLLDMTDEAVMKNFGVTRDELRAKSALEAYRVLLSTPSMKKKLGGSPIPDIGKVVTVSADVVRIVYSDSAGAKCQQQLRKVDGAWLIDRAPACARPKPSE